jgi:hypothetical protein
LDHPSALVFGVLGDLFVGGEATGTVWRFGLDGTPMGRFVEETAEDAGVTGIEFGIDGHLLVADARRGRIGRYDGFAMAWAHVGVKENVDTNLTNDRLPAAIILPTATAPPPSPTASSVATATPGRETPVPSPNVPILLPVVSNG